MSASALSFFLMCRAGRHSPARGKSSFALQVRVCSPRRRNSPACGCAGPSQTTEAEIGPCRDGSARAALGPMSAPRERKRCAWPWTDCDKLARRNLGDGEYCAQHYHLSASAAPAPGPERHLAVLPASTLSLFSGGPFHAFALTLSTQGALPPQGLHPRFYRQMACALLRHMRLRRCDSRV